MDEKVRFVVAYQKAEQSMTELCAAFGISRKTGYEVLERYREAGFDGLAPRSRAPHVHGRATSAEAGAADCRVAAGAAPLGTEKGARGADATGAETLWPAPSTIGIVLARGAHRGARASAQPGPQRR
ncbi:MAG: helix-turn-helix domain-containing protein [Rhodovibrio sp.]|nr:helix-turn-helix domain-containing protein [Rhodovibrio sp.]